MAGQLFFFLTIFIAPTGNQQIPTRTPDLEEWVTQNWSEVLDTLLPLKPCGAADFPQDARWIATLRIEEPHNGAAYRIRLQRNYAGGVKATLVCPPPDLSLFDQAIELKARNPGATPSQVAHKVKLLSLSITNTQCRAVGALCAELESLKLSPILPSELIMDPWIYGFLIESNYGNLVQMSFQTGPDVGDPKQHHPLKAWAEKVRIVFARECERVVVGKTDR